MKTEGNGNDSRALLALGICAKAGKLICGTPMVCEAIRAKRKPLLVAEASDNSGNTAKRLEDKCGFYGIRKVRLNANGEELAAAVGKRSRVAAVAVTDEQLCRLVCGALEQEHII